MEPTISVKGLCKNYGEFCAVQGISFEVQPGEVYCLLGPNGAGKTTTTEILEGYRERTSGDVHVLGFDPAVGGRPFRERIGIVLQECGVQENLTVSELFTMYASYYPRRLATSEVIELVGLDAKERSQVRELSGGQRRRLDVGLALVSDPDVIFLDEPTTGFDPAARRASWSTFRNLSELGKTVLLTTHFMDEAEALADRIAVIVGGQIVAEGEAATLGGRDRARAHLTAELSGDHAQHALPDFADATVTVEGDRLTVDCVDATAAAHTLTNWAADNRVGVDRLTITRPSLEDVYLQLTAEHVDTRTPVGVTEHNGTEPSDTAAEEVSR